MTNFENIFPVTLWNAPFNDSDIIYRENEAEFIHNALSMPGINTVCIKGDYGSGKTYLAKYYAKKYKDLYPGGIIYCSNFMEFYELIETCNENNSHIGKRLIVADEITQMSYERTEFTSKFSNRFNSFKKSFTNTHIILIGYTIHESLLEDSIKLEIPPVSHHKIHESIIDYFLSENLLDIAKINSLVSELSEVSEGNPRKLLTILTHLKSNGFLSSNKIVTLPGIVDAYGKPLKAEDSKFKDIKVELACANDEVMKYFSAHPEAMYKMSGKEFEYFIASVLDRLGYKTTVTPPTNDGGVDIYAAKKDNLGSFLFLIQCKNNKPQNPVGISIIRELYGVLNQKNATFASVFTTSYFSKPAIEFQKQFEHQLSLHDYNDIKNLLNELYMQ